MVPTTWIEINRAGLAQNVRAVKEFIGERVKLLAVVKANAYGHGAVETARIALANGAEYLGVTEWAEGADLRHAGIDAPVLVLGPPLPEQAEGFVRLHLTATVSHAATAAALNAAAQRAGTTARVHVKVDTGMGRFGALPSEVPGLMAELNRLEAVEVEGIYTHFATAYERDKAPTQRQFARFREVLAQLPFVPPLRHVANSAALLDFPEMHLDLVRAGTILYGQWPSAHVTRRFELQPTWTLKTRIVELRTLPPGHPVGYGSEFKTRRETRLATLLVGYAHGLSLAPASLYTTPRAALKTLLGRHGAADYVTIHGQRVPLVGRIAMQTCTADVTDLPHVQLGDEAIVPARRVTTDRGIPRVYVD